MKATQRLIVILALMFLVSNVHAASQVGVSGAWIPQAPPGASMMAGYLTLKNEGDTPVSILAAQSDRFRSVSLHQTVIEEGVSRMRELHLIEMVPGQEVKFAPGGMHLMLMEPRKLVAPGDRIEITFLLSDGQRVPAIFEVQAADSADDAHEHHH
ncbi:MAG TPA: copper chaperone PCu(A)C [Dokdonella sp.]|uniref:copper chaperone PCu(A)C n=1 Tax=Dokdonella sp. TaxID=2291710 RepID=UPI002D807505|nr:copper chaperone PCu(A)C [Dokdonella sp.]HET9033072.1 copper chaperone PCu(A)C [Dokdonella sp.]